MKLQKFSLIDTPGSCSIIYFPKCNLSCPYCYNLKLYNNIIEDTDIDLDEAERYIASLEEENLNGKKYNKVDYVLFSGGEATLYQSSLKKLCIAVKEAGLKSSLYTNGTNPDVIIDLLDDKLLDFISIDYKWLPDHIGYSSAIDLIIQSIIICKDHFKNESLEYFKLNTTLMKSYHTVNTLMMMKDYLSRFIEVPIIKPRKNNLDKHVWTLESFFDDKGKIPTLNGITGEEVSQFEIEELCHRLI